MSAEPAALSVHGLHCSLRAGGEWPGRRPRVSVVRGASFDLRRGETLGLVGESGCGKTTLARALLRLVEPDGGEVRVNGRSLTGLSGRDLRARRREIQMVFQDPERSLSPRCTVGRTLDEALATLPRSRRPARGTLLQWVGLDAALITRYPHELSGGQRQRVAIARALAPGPDVLVADEPVSALDVSVQAQILSLLLKLQKRLGLALLFITHDLAVVRSVAHRVAVMYLGEIVELGPAESVLDTPAHPYTRALMQASPVPDPERARRAVTLPGDVPPAGVVPSGCPFHPRCPQVMDVCGHTVPKETDVGLPGPLHLVRCLLHERR